MEMTCNTYRLEEGFVCCIRVAEASYLLYSSLFPGEIFNPQALYYDDLETRRAEDTPRGLPRARGNE